MNTIVTFVGLFVMIYTQDVGYQVLMPHFTIQPAHESIITYPKADRVEGDWREAGTYLVDGVEWAYVRVVKEFITFSGATNGVPDPYKPSLTQPAPPHLSCCCTALRPTSAGGQGIKNDYKDPDFPEEGKKGAQILVTRGITSTRVKPAGDPNGRIDTIFTMTTTDGNIGIVIEGTIGGSTKRIAFKPGANVIFGNTPICVFEGNCPTNGPESSDFAAYYSMAVQNNTCQGSPSKCQQCGTSVTTTTPCNASTCPSITQQKAAKKTATAQPKPQPQPQPHPQPLETIDCSNSQWP